MTEEQQIAMADRYYGLVNKSEAMRQRPQFTLCMIGLVGAGKSTTLRKIVERLPIAIVSGDEVRRIIHEDGFPAQASEAIANINGRVVGRLAQEGYRVALDNDLGNPKIRAMKMARDEECGISEVWVRVAPPEKFIIDNLSRRHDHPALKDADEAVERYYARKQLHEEDKVAIDALPFVYTFDTSAANFDEQVDEAVQRIEARLESL